MKVLDFRKSMASVLVISSVLACSSVSLAQLSEISAGYAFEAPGFLDMPSAISYDKVRHHLAVADLGRDLVYDFDLTDQSWVTYGEKNEISEPSGLAYGPDGSLYILTKGNPLLYKFRPGLDLPDTAHLPEGDNGRAIIPGRMCVARENLFYIIDSKKPVIYILNEHLERIGEITDKLNKPDGICIDEDGEVLVADRNPDPVSKFSPAGKFIQRLTRPEPATAKLLVMARGLALDQRGWVYTIDESGRKLLWYDPTGIIHGEWAPDDPAFSPVDLAIDKQNRIFILESIGGRVIMLGRDY